MKKNNLILILARGGNENIARLNLRLVDGKPLLFHILDTAIKSKLGDVYVSTDSEEIKQLTLLYGGKVINRPKKLTKNLTPLEEITKHALLELKTQKLFYNKCLIVSPIFPLLKISTIKKFFKEISIKTPIIFGFINYNNSYFKIKNLSTIHKISKIKNNLVVMKKIFAIHVPTFMKKNKLSRNLYGLELSKEEGITITDYHDLSTVEKILQRKKILVRVDGGTDIGLGHVYNMLTILNYLRDNEILIVMNKKKNLGDYKFKQQNYKLSYFSTDSQLWEIIRKFQPNIVFNDILDTLSSYIKRLKRETSLIVNFEDLGRGADYADLVFNPIYDLEVKNKNKFFGSRYACVRDEFRLWKTHPVRKHVKKVLITFGGTDPNNITSHILKIIDKSNLFNVEFVIVLGIGNTHREEIYNYISRMRHKGFLISIVEKSDIMAKYIVDSDFVITSNGRTVFEVASVKVPMITMSANERESKHMFSKSSCGAISLGSITQLDSDIILKSIKKMMNYNVRINFVKNLEKFDLFEGVQEILDLINKKYEQIRESQAKN